MEPEKSMMKEFLEGGWLIPLLGAASMLARLISTNTPVPVLEQVKKVFVAALASGIAWFLLEQTDIGSLYKAITYGVIGVISPEIIAGLVSIGKKFASKPESFLPRK
jgi:hypothetical protein